ncbi:MAG TPA: hypothetical protein DD376_02580 [Sutterella sp.]|nr:hypothetical protein [Sutterella sp.]
MQSDKENSETVQVLTRIHRLLNVLVQKGIPCGVRSLARNASLAPSTTQRLMAGLQEQGFAEQTSERKWIPGNTLIVLGFNALREKHLASPDSAIFQDLEQETGAVPFLGIRIGDCVALMSKNETRLLPLHESVAGIALLSGLPQENISAYMTQNRLEGTKREFVFLQCEILRRNEWIGAWDEATGYTVAAPVTAPGQSLPTASVALLFQGKTSCDTSALKSLLKVAKTLSQTRTNRPVS